MAYPSQHVATDDELLFYTRWLDDIGDGKIARIDWEESRCADIPATWRDECRTRKVERFGLSALPRSEQARILRALELNLTPRSTVDGHAPGPYSLKHDAENYIRLTEGRPYYVSDLQARTCMRIMGYEHTLCTPYRYNVSMRSYNRWRRDMREMSRTR